MSQPWLLVSLLLASTAVLYAAVRVSRFHRRRLDAEIARARSTAELHLATIEALALAIDAKDQTAANHIRRVQAYATGVARAIGLPDDEVEAVRMAAVLHDIGKLAVPDHILAKPGALTAEEFQKVRIHSQMGADIIGGVPFPQPVAPMILGHHERWDGRGYPAGLKEERIPIGARILAVADCFDALTSDRPYHKAIGLDEALAVLQQDAGKAFDPRLVATFAQLLPQLRHEIQREGLAVFDDIALAHREIYALYQIAQAMGTSLGVTDTMALISTKLSDLVPFSSCALFLYSSETDSLTCRFATGVDATLIEQVAVRSGQGLHGWVARNRRALVNARPGADFEAMNPPAATTLESALVCPLLCGDRFIGTLAVYHTAPGFYRDDHRRLLDRICEQAAAVIHNSIVFEQTQEDSLTDPLTGLPNTRFMFMHLTRELARANRLKSEVSLLVMDLNGFKGINDTYGHHVGDSALREVANVLKAAIRPYDICVRYAGDEFIVVLSGCGHDEAEAKRIELQAEIDRLVFEVRPGMRLPLSISAGAAVFPHDGESYESLLAKADSRMYREKSLRKNNPTRQLSAGTAPLAAIDEALPTARAV